MRTFAVGDFVNYKQNGICKITDIVEQDFAQMGAKDYYKLSPIHDEKTVIFVPVDSESLNDDMYCILTKEEIDEVISKSLCEEHNWIEDHKERASVYSNILLSKDRAKIISVLLMLMKYKQSVEETKRKMYASDIRILTAAQKIITEEFSFVLGVGKEDVIQYILDRIK